MMDMNEDWQVRCINILKIYARFKGNIWVTDLNEMG